MSVTVRRAYDAASLEATPALVYKPGEIPYIVSGVSEEGEALSAAATGVAQTYQGMPLSSVKVDRILNPAMFRVIARYKTSDIGTSSINSSDPEPVLRFKAGGGTKRITEALELVEASENAPDVGKMINYDGEKASGVDIIDAPLDFTLTRYLTSTQIDGAFMKNLKKFIGHTNADAWRNFDAGEVLLVSVEGGDQKDSSKDYVELVYSFSVRVNELGVEVAEGVSFAMVYGWDLAWNYFGREVAGGRKKPKLLGSYVVRVYPSIDFKTLGV